jgi:hypothetical protein
MSKHNKKRNTAFLYEALVREVVKQTIDKDAETRNKVVCILKSAFSSKNELGKELKLFKALMETRDVNTRIGEKLIQETKRQYKKLNEKQIFAEQSALIKKINKEISKSVFSNFVPNYKDIATLSQIFGDDVSVKHRVVLEERILAKMSSKSGTKLRSDKVNNLVVNKFIDRFNGQYNKTLSENQKTLLNKYILSFMDNGTDLKVYLNEEIYRLKEAVKKSFSTDELKKDKNMSEKMKNVQDLLESFRGQRIDKSMLQALLKIQLLVKEVQS